MVEQDLPIVQLLEQLILEVEEVQQVVHHLEKLVDQELF